MTALVDIAASPVAVADRATILSKPILASGGEVARDDGSEVVLLESGVVFTVVAGEAAGRRMFVPMRRVFAVLFGTEGHQP